MSENNNEIYFQIHPSSGIPIYKQIVDQVERLVASGHLSPGDEIPSVRKVATHFEVNPMTVSKAYSILETSNILERRRGRGMVVASNSENTKTIKERLELIKPSIKDIAEQAKQLNLPADKIIELFRKLMETNNGK